ncbi:MAG: sugar MFS transporter [Chitinispirillaceae bacterium]|nr:sugar MFS transporter [Chitinispirillaceae bacterium]
MNSNSDASMTTSNDSHNYRTAFIVLTSLFFMWGFITVLNGILIPFLKKVFELNRYQSMFVQFTFFGAYFVGSVIYFIISVLWGDPMSKMGYKNGCIFGLLISAAACAGFYPAAAIREYNLFLAMLFFLGIGFTLLQIAANPYIALLGKPETASSRLNLSQAFNSFGTTVGPVIGGFLVFYFFTKIGSPLLNAAGEPILTDKGLTMTAMSVQLPYLVFAGIFLLLAIIVKMTHLPQFISHEQIEKGIGALRYPHLVLGGIAIFVYVGAEVSIGSLLINFAGEIVKMPEITAKSYLAFYWGGAMIGRFLGAISLGENKNTSSMYIRMLITLLVAYGFIYGIIYFESVQSGEVLGFTSTLPYIIFLAVQYLGFIIGKSHAGRTLGVFALIVIGLLTITTFSSGYVALWSVIAVGLFNSIMWSNIFTLAIKDLGQHTSQGSSLLVMMILGGAIVPLVQGRVADMMGGYQMSFFIPIVCYVYLAFYGLKGHAVKSINSGD